jgi:hypothetical protein
VPSPNADAASRRAPATASASRSAERTTRMPRPPPPKAALTSSGNPMVAATAARSDPSVTVAPGSTGTPAASISALASTLEPIAAMVPGDGPTNTSPAAVQARANPAFSDRNP